MSLELHLARTENQRIYQLLLSSDQHDKYTRSGCKMPFLVYLTRVYETQHKAGFDRWYFHYIVNKSTEDI